MSEYAYALDDTHYVFRLRAQAGDLVSCTLWYADRAAMGELKYVSTPMKKSLSDNLYDYFEKKLTTPLDRISYYFEFSDGKSTTYYLGGVFQNNLDSLRSDAFQFSFNHRSDRMSVPGWMQDAVVYNIFPDSFASGKEEISGLNKKAVWKGNPTYSLLGGTINGIRESLDYIKSMGFNCIYLNPIFAANSYHKYDTVDYFHIDPCFGTDEDFRELVHAVHKRGMRIIIDGVFNHISSRHPFFKDVLEKGKDSEYFDCFYYLPDKPELPKNGELPKYTCFAYVSEMPKTNLANEKACEYFCHVGEYWIKEYDIDGWRLDVANEINDGFLRAFRQRIKQAKPEAAIIGEVWEDGSHYLQGDMLDSCMNYDFRRFAIYFFAKRYINASELSIHLNWMLTRYKDPAMRAQLNLLDSHDVNRFLTDCGNDIKRASQAIVFQMTLPGMPSVFYGDEAAILGATEPEYRQKMKWQSEKPLKTLYTDLIGLRHEYKALSHGEFRLIEASDRFFAYSMNTEEYSIMVLFNSGDEDMAISSYIDDSEVLYSSEYIKDTLGAGEYIILKK